MDLPRSSGGVFPAYWERIRPSLPVPRRGRPVLSRALFSPLLAATTAVCLLLGLPALSAFALPVGFQEYYILGNETQVHAMFVQIQQGGSSPGDRMASVITAVATADRQIVYYDHWEDGYEPDLLNPLPGGSTEIYGDGDLTNGSINDDDTLRAGDIITLNSDGSGSGIHQFVDVAPRGNELRYDSSDRVVSIGGPTDITHSLWPSGGTWLGGAWEIYPVQAWGDVHSYVVPIGEELYDGSTGYFPDLQHVWLEIQALDDNTTVYVDNGTEAVSVRLDRGQSYSSMGYRDSTTAGIPSITINAGTTVLVNKQIQGGLVTGRQTNQTRFYTLVPDAVWDTEYVAPIPRTDYQAAEVYLFNPDNEAHMVTAYDADTPPTGVSFPLTATTALAYRHPSAVGRYVPPFSSLRLRSDGPVWAVASADNSELSHDWGFAFVPTRYAGKDYIVSWAPGSDGVRPNASPVWVAPLSDNTAFSVDYSAPTMDGSSRIDGIPDEHFVLDALQIRRVFDPTDGINTGMRIQADKPFVAVWGEDPAVANASSGLDMGYPVLPLDAVWQDTVLTLHKSPESQVLPPAGGTITFTLRAQAADYSVTDVNLTDTLPISWTYAAGSAVVTYPDGSTGHVEPTIDGQTLAWPLSAPLGFNQNIAVTFQAQFTNTAGLGDMCYDDMENGGYDGGAGWSGPWVEDETPCSGNCVDNTTSVVHGPPHSGSQHIVVSGAGTISRTADLSSFQQPFVRFWRRLNSLGSDDAFYLRLYDGLEWTSALTFTEHSNQGSYIGEEVDLTPYLSSSFALELRGSATNDENEYIYLDDVEIFDASAVQRNEAEATSSYLGYLFSSRDEAVVVLSPLDLHLDADSSAVAGGDNLAYTLTYEHSSQVLTATNVLVRHILPANTTFLSASPGATYLPAAHTVVWGSSPTMTLPPGATGALTTSVAVDPWATNGQVLRSESYVDSDQTVEVASNPVEGVVLAPEVRLAKTGPASANPGQVITYRIEYANKGPITATGVLITDVIPISTTYQANSLSVDTGGGYVALTDADDGDAGRFTGSELSIRPGGLISGQIGPGETGHIRFAVRVDPATPAGENIANHATLARDYARPANSALLLTAITDLTLSKSASHVVAGPGTSLTYTVTLGSSGAPGQTEVYVRESIPAHTCYVSGTAVVPPGFVLDYSVDHGETWTSIPPPTSTQVTDLRWYTPTIDGVTNSAMAYQAQVEDPLSAAGVVIINRAYVTSTQTPRLYSNEVHIPTVDLAVNKTYTGPPVAPGQHITYTIAYVNNGSAAAPGAVLTDRVPVNTALLPASITGGGVTDGQVITWVVDLPPEGLGTVRFAVAITDPLPSGVDSIANTVSIAGGPGVGDTDTLTVPVSADAELAVSKSDSQSTIRPGDVLTYTLVLSNTGNQAASGVVLTDSLPDHTTYIPGSASDDGVYLPASHWVSWTFAPLAGRTTVTRTFEVTVDTALLAAVRQITNTATVVDDGANGDTPAGNVATDVDTVIASPALNVTKSGPILADVGDTVVFDFSVTNDSANGDGSPIWALSVHDSIAGIAAYVDGDGNSNSMLEVGETWTFSVTYTIPPTAPSPMTNTVIATGYDWNGDPVSDSDTHTTTLEYVPTLYVAKYGPATAGLGDTVEFVFAVSNADFTPTSLHTGSGGDGSPIGNLAITDSIVSLIHYVYGDDGNLLLDKGETWVYTASYTIQDTDPDPLINTVTVTGQDRNGDMVGDADTHGLDIDYVPVLDVDKRGPATAEVDDTVTFTFTIASDSTLGDGSVIGNISITDSAVGAPIYLSGDDGDHLLSSGESWVYVASYRIRETDPDLLITTCTVVGTDRDDDPVTATCSHTIIIGGEGRLIYLPIILE